MRKGLGDDVISQLDAVALTREAPLDVPARKCTENQIKSSYPSLLIYAEAKKIFDAFCRDYRVIMMNTMREKKAQVDQFSSYSTSHGYKVTVATTFGASSGLHSPLTMGMAQELQMLDDVKHAEALCSDPSIELLGPYPNCPFDVEGPTIKFPSIDGQSYTKAFMPGSVSFALGKHTENNFTAMDFTQNPNTSTQPQIFAAMERAEVLREQRFHLGDGTFIVYSVTHIDRVDYENIAEQLAFDCAKTIEMHKDFGMPLGGGIPTVTKIRMTDAIDQREVLNIVSLIRFRATVDNDIQSAPKQKIESKPPHHFEDMMQRYGSGECNTPDHPEELKLGLPRTNSRGYGFGSTIDYFAIPSMTPLSSESAMRDSRVPWKVAGDDPQERDEFFNPVDGTLKFEQEIFNCMAHAQEKIFLAKKLNQGSNDLFQVKDTWIWFNTVKQPQMPDGSQPGVPLRPMYSLHFGYFVDNCFLPGSSDEIIPEPVLDGENRSEFMESHAELKLPRLLHPVHSPTTGGMSMFLEGFAKYGSPGFNFYTNLARMEIVLANQLRRNPDFKSDSARPIWGQFLESIIFTDEFATRICLHLTGTDPTKSTGVLNAELPSRHDYFGDHLGFGMRKVWMKDGVVRGYPRNCCNTEFVNTLDEYAKWMGLEIIQLCHLLDGETARRGALLPGGKIFVCGSSEAPLIDHSWCNLGRADAYVSEVEYARQRELYSGGTYGFPEADLIWDQYNRYTTRIDTEEGAPTFLSYFDRGGNPALMQRAFDAVGPSDAFIQKQRSFWRLRKSITTDAERDAFNSRDRLKLIPLVEELEEGRLGY